MRFLLFLLLFLPLNAFSTLNTPQNVKIVDRGSDILKITFTWQPPLNISGVFNTTFRIFAKNISTNQIIESTSTFTGLIPTKIEYVEAATNLQPNTTYRISVKVEISGLTFNDASLVSNESANQLTTQNRTYGLTVITHGFDILGGFPAGFLNYARELKARLNGNATIYYSKHINGLDYWELDGSENGGELILVYDWGSLSNGISTNGSLGRLEYAADRLFALLIQPIKSNGRFIKGYNGLGEMLSKKQSHFIGHSRGGVLLLQVIHRLSEHFPNINIEQYTGLDPHPAAAYGDVNSMFDNVDYNLPCVNGAAFNCTFLTCSTGLNINLSIPENVIYANNYYRKDGNYEEVASNETIAPFDGVNLNGGINRELNNNSLSSWLGVCGVPIGGGAHSSVHYWYFSTVNLNKCVNPVWYAGNIDRVFSGFYQSRLGGGLYTLPLPTYRISNENMNSSIRSRQNGKPLQLIFNGNFEYPISEEWRSNNGELEMDNGKVKLPSSQTNNFVILQRSQFYIPKTKAHLNFEVSNINIEPNSLVSIDWYVGKEKITTIGPQCLEGGGTFSTEIPKQLLGKVARFAIVFNNSNSPIGDFELDNFDISESPNGRIINNEGYCCNHKVTIEPSEPQTICGDESVTLRATATNSSTFKWFKNGKEIGSGSSITVDSTASYSVLAQKIGAECITSASNSVNKIENTSMNFKLKATLPNNNQCAYDSTNKILTLCQGQSVNISGVGCDGRVVWSDGKVKTDSTVTIGGTYTATCKIGQTCQKSDTVIIKIETATLASLADAGADNAYCGKQTITLNGNTPENGCGTWSIVSPTGEDIGSFSDIHNPKASFTPKQFGTYRLQWNISLVCGNNSSSDFVDLNFVEQKKVKELKSRMFQPNESFSSQYTLITASPVGGTFYYKQCTPEGFPQFCFDGTVSSTQYSQCYDNSKVCFKNIFPPVLVIKQEWKYVFNNPPCPTSEKKINFTFKYP